MKKLLKYPAGISDEINHACSQLLWVIDARFLSVPNVTSISEVSGNRVITLSTARNSCAKGILV